MTDHLAELCFNGPGSTGRYTPHSFTLHLQGTEQPADHVVYLHEVHHAALNDVTAWGSALHVYARLPADARLQFALLLNACRTTHESLATFASVELATARHGALGHVLNAYPDYVPLHDATVRLTAGVEGTNRRQLTASALARLCMQTPVLELILAVGLDGFRLSSVPDIDRPDSRWNWFAREGPDLLADAAAVADRAVTAAFGQSALVADGPGNDLYSSTNQAYDKAWEAWEASAYEHLRSALAITSAQTLSINGHQEATAALLALVEALHGDLGIRTPMDEEQRYDEASVASSILQQVRCDLTDNPYRAALLALADTAALVEMLASRPVAGGQPALVIDARPAQRLADLYRWPGGILPESLHASPGPVVAIRAAIDDGELGTVVGHAVIPEPAMLAAVAERWRSRGHLVSCVTASCLADAAWAQHWVPPLISLGPLFVLADVEPDRFVPAWARNGNEVMAVHVDISHSGHQRAALVLTADRGISWWLVVADDVTAHLMAEYLRSQLGTRLHSNEEMLSPVRDATMVAISHLLATESFVTFSTHRTSNAD
jgi:hypothetical protein